MINGFSTFLKNALRNVATCKFIGFAKCYDENVNWSSCYFNEPHYDECNDTIYNATLANSSMVLTTNYYQRRTTKLVNLQWHRMDFFITKLSIDVLCKNSDAKFKKIWTMQMELKSMQKSNDQSTLDELIVVTRRFWNICSHMIKTAPRSQLEDVFKLEPREMLIVPLLDGNTLFRIRAPHIQRWFNFICNVLVW